MSDTQDYDYELPRELIAQHPLPYRPDARLMVVDRQRQTWEHRHVRDLPQLLRAEDTLVLNDTRVLPARLVGFRTRTGGKWQGLFLSSHDTGIWHVMGKTRGKLQPGETITLVDRQAVPAARLVLLAQLSGGEWAVRPDEDTPPFDLLARVGRVPLPGYIRDGEMEAADEARYQTVFAAVPGAVAAPTAGLHFTRDLLDAIASQGVALCHITLHVGVGTFRPIVTSTLEEHRMHREWGCVPAAVVEAVRARRRRGGRAIAIGTTVVRSLESAAASGELQPWQGETQLFIRPPYSFRAVDALLTNFHLPRSTLLVLVRTFGGDSLIRRAYEAAVREEYRFYSYGDAMFIH